MKNHHPFQKACEFQKTRGCAHTACRQEALQEAAVSAGIGSTSSPRDAPVSAAPHIGFVAAACAHRPPETRLSIVVPRASASSLKEPRLSIVVPRASASSPKGGARKRPQLQTTSVLVLYGGGGGLGESCSHLGFSRGSVVRRRLRYSRLRAPPSRNAPQHRGTTRLSIVSKGRRALAATTPNYLSPVFSMSGKEGGGVVFAFGFLAGIGRTCPPPIPAKPAKNCRRTSELHSSRPPARTAPCRNAPQHRVTTRLSIVSKGRRAKSGRNSDCRCGCARPKPAAPHIGFVTAACAHRPPETRLSIVFPRASASSPKGGARKRP